MRRRRRHAEAETACGGGAGATSSIRQFIHARRIATTPGWQILNSPCQSAPQRLQNMCQSLMLWIRDACALRVVVPRAANVLEESPADSRSASVRSSSGGPGRRSRNPCNAVSVEHRFVL